MVSREALHILAASGSSRPGNYTRRVLGLAVDELRTRHQVQVDLIDLSNADFPFPGQSPSQATKQAQDLVKAAAGVLLATPEYHGSYSSAMKRFIENLGFPSTLAGKPVALLGAAAGQIGAVKALEHLGSVCSHVGAFVLPGPVSVARVQKVFDQGRALPGPSHRNPGSRSGHPPDGLYPQPHLPWHGFGTVGARQPDRTVPPAVVLNRALPFPRRKPTHGEWDYPAESMGICGRLGWGQSRWKRAPRGWSIRS